MKIYISKTEADMLHHAINEFMLGVGEQEDELEGASGFSKKETAALLNFKRKIVQAFS
jgi:hypothetical protein